MHPKLRVVTKFLMRHRGKLSFLVVVGVLIAAFKKGIVGKLFFKLLGTLDKKLRARAAADAEKNKAYLERLNQTNSELDAYLAGGFKEATAFVATYIGKNLGNEGLFAEVQAPMMTREGKLKVWETIGRNSLKQILFILTVKPLVDLSHFVLQLLTQKDQKKEGEFSIYTAGVPQEILRRFVGDFNQFLASSWEAVVANFACRVDGFWDWGIELTEKTSWRHLQHALTQKVSLWLETQVTLEADDTPLASMFDPRTSASKVLVTKWRLREWLGSFWSSKRLLNLSEALMETFRGFQVACPSHLYGQNEVLVQQFLDVMASDFTARFVEVSREHLCQKILNRFLVIYKKEFDDDTMLESTSALYLAKIFSVTEKMLKEEFLSADCLEQDRGMLMGRLKLSFYLRKHHQPQAAEAPADSAAPDNPPVASQEQDIRAGYGLGNQDLLNQSFIGRINLDSPNTIFATELFLKELTLLEAEGLALKSLASQLKTA